MNVRGGGTILPLPSWGAPAQDAVTRLQPAVLDLAARLVPFAAQHPLAPAGAGPVQFFDFSFCCWIATFLHLLPFVSAYLCLRLKTYSLAWACPLAAGLGTPSRRAWLG